MTKKITRRNYRDLLVKLDFMGHRLIRENTILDLFESPVDLLEYCLEILKREQTKVKPK